jgi:uncharacterized membrane protein
VATKLRLNPVEAQVLFSVGVLSVLALFLSNVRFIVTGSTQYWFLLWNLLLAWVPLVSAYYLFQRSKKGLYWSWPNFALSVTWLLFLPNAFYLITDFIHLQYFGPVDVLFDILLFLSYAIAGLAVGYVSLVLFHYRLWHRFGVKAHYIIAGVLVLSSFAIYLGRFLRWNSWDIIFNPFAILFDITERIINPIEHIATFSVSLLFFVFLATLYVVVWRSVMFFLRAKKL